MEHWRSSVEVVEMIEVLSECGPSFELGWECGTTFATGARPSPHEPLPQPDDKPQWLNRIRGAIRLVYDFGWPFERRTRFVGV